MQKTQFKKALSMFVCTVLVAAIALLTFGCNSNTPDTQQTAEPSTGETSAQATALGEGSKKFTFTVTDPDGKTSVFEINTDEETVGEALEQLGLIEGEEGTYGLYVKTVNGITVDYDKDGMYWAFYTDGEMATAGVDMTDIVAGAVYAFKAEK